MTPASAPIVLVVDDNDAARRLVRMGLELEGITVVEADTVARARQFLHAGMQGVVLDRELPDGDGLDLLADIGATCPDASIVINSTRDDGNEPAWVVKVDKGDLPEIVRGLDLSAARPTDDHLAVVDLVRAEASAVVNDWIELCRWDPLLPPDSTPPLADRVVEAMADALERPQPLGWGADPALATVTEAFATRSGAIDVAVGQLVCLREAFRRHVSGHVPPAEEAETRARVDMIVDRAIWSATRVAAARLERQLSFDPLTGLGNAKAFEAELDRELERAKRYRRPASVVMVGLPALERLMDGTEGANGPDGPEAQDAQGIVVSVDDAIDAQVRRTANVLATNVRRQDGVYRLSGATFGLLLPDTDVEGARTLLARLEQGLGGDATLGSASFPDDGEDASSLLYGADRARRPVASGARSTR